MKEMEMSRMIPGFNWLWIIVIFIEIPGNAGWASLEGKIKSSFGSRVL